MACVRLFVIILLIVSAVITFAEGKHWPDFSCHPSNDTYIYRNAFSFHRMGWESCKENYEVNKGKCDKICVLIKQEVLIRKYKNGPFDFKPDAFLTIFREELGCDENDSPPEAVQGLINKVKLELEKCKKNHPEYGTLPVKNTPCEPWDKITMCIDKAVGC